MIIDGATASPPPLLQGRSNAVEHGFILDGDLDVDHVLRWQAGYGRGTYVIDPLGVLPEGGAKVAFDPDELVWPSLVGFPNHDEGHHVIRCH